MSKDKQLLIALGKVSLFLKKLSLFDLRLSRLEITLLLSLIWTGNDITASEDFILTDWFLTSAKNSFWGEILWLN